MPSRDLKAPVRGPVAAAATLERVTHIPDEPAGPASPPGPGALSNAPRPIPGAGPRVVHVRPALGHASCDPPKVMCPALAPDWSQRGECRLRQRQDHTPSRSLALTALVRWDRPPTRRTSSAISMGNGTDAVLLAMLSWRDVTQNAAAECPRAAHGPRSPGSADVPPACGSTSASRPLPSA